MGWKQKELADKLGLKKRVIQYYEKGKRDGKDVEVPLSIRLACYALSVGVEDFDGTIELPAITNGSGVRTTSRKGVGVEKT